MNIISRFSIITFVIIALSVLAACGEEESVNSSVDSSSANSEYAQGVTDNEIIVGHSAAQTGPVAVYDNVRKGMQAYFNYVNENGGINGREVKIIAYDDEYQPAKTLQNIQRLVDEDNVFALLGPIGTANINAAQSFIEESGVPIVGLATGADKFVNPPIENIFGLTFNYKLESKILVEYIVEEIGAENIALLYQNDDFGMDNLNFAKEALENYDVEIAAEIPFLASDVDFSSHTQKILDADPDTILMFSTPGPVAHLKKELFNRNIDIPFVTTSTGGGDEHQFEVAGEEVWEGTIVSIPGSPDKSEIADYDLYVERMLMDYSESELGGLAEQGWSTAKIFEEGIKRSGDDLSWENFIAQMNTFENWEETFFPSITYTPEHRYGNTTLHIVEAKDGQLSELQKMHYDIETGEIIYE
ncbi:ABC transporter substrate-binding protein [Oceanobacillus longus]|uniref:ABC transporter substrate-binding protein n=1 Tax=Oceanobacillus longus TaxID=930120 RepID=A0ABV8GVS7_9BACI